MSPNRIARRALLVAITVLALPAAAHANFAVVAPAEGSSTVLNEVKTDWAGTCPTGMTCSGLELVYSRRADLDASGRLAEFASTDADADPYKTTYVGDPAPMTALSPRLNPAPWFLQLQWRQCPADFSSACADLQSPLTSFTVAHQLLRPVIQVTARYRYIRVLDFQARFTGNAPTYTVQGIVSVQKRRPNGRKFWARSWTKTEKGYGQFGENKEYFSYTAKGRVARGAKLRLQAIVRAPGMKPRTLTMFTTSP